MAVENSTVWITGMGVARVRETNGAVTVTTYSRANGFTGEWIQAVMVDHENNVWFGTASGMQRLRSADAFTLPVVSQLPIGRFYEPLAVDARGSFWAIVPEGVMELSTHTDGALLQTLHTKSRLGLRSNLTSIRIDSRQRMWFADDRNVLHSFFLRDKRLIRQHEFIPRAIQPHRRHFWLLFKEIITNIAKHSQCREVHIRLTVEDELIFNAVHTSLFVPRTAPCVCLTSSLERC